MTALASRPPTLPRWRTLAPLTLGVLLVHLVLLSGGWSGDPNTVFGPAESTGTELGSSLTPREAAPAAISQPEAPEPVSTSRVRWIVLPPPAPPEPEPQAEPARPKPEPKPLPPPQPEPAPEPPVAVPAEPEPPPVEEIAQAPDSAALPDPGLPVELAPTEAQADPPTDAPAGPDTLPQAQTPVAAETPTATETGPVSVGAAPAASVPATGLLPGDADLPPAQVAPTIRLMYQVTGRIRGINYNAAGALEWSNLGTRYNAYMAVRAFLVGSRGQTSEGSLGSVGLVPERFTDKSRTERSAQFDAVERRIRFSNNAPEADWLPGGQDRLSVFLQLGALLQARPDAYPPGSTITVQVTGPGDAEVWRFELGPEEMLSLPAGDMRARLITRAPRKAFDTRTELWLAPDLHHLPVRIRITQSNGDHIEQVLRYMP